MSLRLPSHKLAQACRKPSKGFTLLELLVSMFILGVIGTVLVGILSQSQSLVSQGASVIGSHQKARNAFDRIAPYVATAVSTSKGEAILIPKEKSNDFAEPTFDFRVVFHTTEDFLNPAYDPTAPYDPIAQVVFTYEIAFVPDSAAPGSLGKIMLRRLVEGSDTVDTTREPRPLAFNVQQFRCLLLTSNSLQMVIDQRVQRKTSRGELLDEVKSEQAILSIPASTYK